MKKIVLLLVMAFFTGCGLQQTTFVPNSPYIQGRIQGFSFEYVSCTGKSSEGKVYLTFVYSHNLAPQDVAISGGNSAYAVDHSGNRYAMTPFNGQYKTTQPYTPERVVTEIRGIPPSVTSFSIISQGFVSNTVGVSNSRKETDLLFRNVSIRWE